MCRYIGSDLKAICINKDLYIKVMSDIEWIRRTRGTKSFSTMLSRFLDMIGFEKFDIFIEYNNRYCSIKHLQEVELDDNMDELLYKYKRFLTYTHYQVSEEENGFILYKRTSGMNYKGNKCYVSIDFIVSMMAMFITENVYLDYSNIEYLSGDVRTFYSLFIKSYKKNKCFTEENLKMNHTNNERNIEYWENMLKICKCGECSHNSVCRFKELVPDIKDVEEPFEVSIKCKYFFPVRSVVTMK